MPQPKKDPSIRARANVASTAKTLERATGYEVPELPDFLSRTQCRGCRVGPLAPADVDLVARAFHVGVARCLGRL